jgi:hypothetical protein
MRTTCLIMKKIKFCDQLSGRTRNPQSRPKNPSSVVCIFLICIVGGEVQLSPLGTAATNRPIVPVPCDYDDGEIGGIIGRGNRSTRRKPVPVPLCPPQTSYATRT